MAKTISELKTHFLEKTEKSTEPGEAMGWLQCLTSLIQVEAFIIPESGADEEAGQTAKANS